MSEFSYNSDIAPLRNNFFSDIASSRSLSEREKGMLNSQYSARLKSSLEAQSKAADAMIETQKQQIAFAEADLRLKTTRKQIQDQLDLEEALPKIEPMLTALIDDQNMDTPTKILQAEKYRLQFGKFGSPLINNYFDNTIKALGTKDVNEALRKQAAYDVARLGDKTGAQSIVGTGTEAAQTLGVLADTVRQKQLQELKSQKEQSLFESQEEKEKGKTEVLKNQLEYIQRLTPARDELKTGERGWGEGTTGTTGTTDVTQPFLKPVDKIALLKMYKNFNPIATNIGEKDISDYDLVEGVYGKLYDEYTTRTGAKPASKISEKSK